MQDLIGARQRYIFERLERKERRIWIKHIAKKLLKLIFGAIVFIAMCATWFWLYWFVCP